jgi:hypothetical protein
MELRESRRAPVVNLDGLCIDELGIPTVDQSVRGLPHVQLHVTDASFVDARWRVTYVSDVGELDAGDFVMVWHDATKRFQLGVFNPHHYGCGCVECGPQLVAHGTLVDTPMARLVRDQQIEEAFIAWLDGFGATAVAKGGEQAAQEAKLWIDLCLFGTEVDVRRFIAAQRAEYDDSLPWWCAACPVEPDFDAALAILNGER